MDLLPLECNYRFFYREEHREPTVHAWRVLTGIRTVEHILIELCCEVTTEAMDLALLLLNGERYSVELFHAGVFALAITFDVLHNLWVVNLGVGDVSESEHFLGLVSAREGS